jgi:dCMP deaminase
VETKNQHFLQLVSVIRFEDYLRKAYKLASEQSTDRVTNVGALIIHPYTGDILTQGVNAFTDKNQYKNESNHLRPRKYKVTEHAERAAIFSAARYGIATAGMYMVCPWASCPDCARAIVKSGISKLIGHKQALDRTPERWKDDVALGLEILAGGGVEYLPYDGKIGGVEILFDGQRWQP